MPVTRIPLNQPKAQIDSVLATIDEYEGQLLDARRVIDNYIESARERGNTSSPSRTRKQLQPRRR